MKEIQLSKKKTRRFGLVFKENNAMKRTIEALTIAVGMREMSAFERLYDHLKMKKDVKIAFDPDKGIVTVYD